MSVLFVFSVDGQNEPEPEIEIIPSNSKPVCESFKSIASADIGEDGVYPVGTTFGFEVVAFDIDQDDTINKVAFSIIDANSNENIAEVLCEPSTLCEQSISEVDSDIGVPFVTSKIETYSFPDGGNYIVAATVGSSDGTSVKCAVLNENE